MPVDVTANISASLSWAAIDTGTYGSVNIVDTSKVYNNETYITGVGTQNKINFAVLLNSEANGQQAILYDLTAVPQIVFGLTGYANYSGGYIKGLQVNNISSGSAEILVNFSGAQFFGVSANKSSNLKVRPGGCFVISDSNSGYPINHDNKYFYVLNTQPMGGEIAKYEIGIIGKI